MPCKPLYCMCGSYAAPQRHVMATMAVFSIILMYAHRVCLSLAIVEMVVPVKKAESSLICPLYQNETSTIKNIQGGARDWSEFEQSVILQAFYVGYLLMHIPAGYLCDRYGAKLFLSLGIFVSSLSTGLVPPAVILFDSYIPLAILRVLCGLGQAVLYPGVSSLLSRWIPLSERGVVGGFTLSANALGAVLGTMCTGVILKWTRSWVWVFIIWCILGLILNVFFHLYVYSYPEVHKHITDKEKELLAESIGEKERIGTPIKEILKDIRVWALMITQIGYDYFHYTVLSNLPKYMNNVLNYKVMENAVVSTVPHICMFLTAILSGKLGDWLISKRNCKVVCVRVWLTALSLVFPAVFMLLGGYMNCERTLAVVFFCIAMAGKGFFYAGLKVNIIDVSKNHSGIIMALVNGAGSVSGIIAPYVIASIAKDNTLSQWHLVFWVMVIIAVISCIIYFMFAKGERAEWDYKPEEREEHEVDKKWYKVFSCYKPY